MSPVDVIVIGAGPVGLACGVEAIRNDLTCRIIDKGALVNSLIGYPTNMEFFSTPDLLEIGGHPFPTSHYKPLREEAIDYYRGVAVAESLDVRLYEPVIGLEGSSGAFMVATDKARHPCNAVVIASGFFDVPNLLGCEGEELAKVSHYYKEPFSYSGQRVAIVGGKNSACIAALKCQRHGADVTMIVREPDLGASVKYWIRPDAINRIKEGRIKAYFSSTISSIAPNHLNIETPNGMHRLANDWVLALIGYRPDYNFLTAMGVETEDDLNQTPRYDAETFETNRAGVFIAGTICGGLNTSRWFIENGRFHASQIMGVLKNRRSAAEQE